MSMDSYSKDHNEKCFNDYIAEVLSIYCQETNQEDYTSTLRHIPDMEGRRYKEFRSRNWRMLNALERLKVKYRSALSKW